MIVRIFTDGQYRLDDAERAPIEHLDEALRKAADGGDEVHFKGALAELVHYVRHHGDRARRRRPRRPSDLMIPPPDTPLEEAQDGVHRRGPDTRTEVAAPPRGR